MVPHTKAEPRQMAQEFDRLIDDALDEREARYGYPVFEMHYLRRMKVAELADGYLAGGAYPPDRLSGVVERAIDTKLQMYLTSEILPAMLNVHYHDRVNSVSSDVELASVQLVLLSIHQDLIFKSRILWERIMGLVFFLETGKEDISRTGTRSTKRTFFEMCASTPRWRWMVPYSGHIVEYDDRLRTPEAHKRSTLRSRLMRGEDLVAQTNEILSLLNLAMNQVWDNTVSIASGGGVVSLGTAHMLAGGDLAATNPFDEWGWTPE
jgi:hypothetical protein